jgi:hypothetical protein
MLWFIVAAVAVIVIPLVIAGARTRKIDAGSVSDQWVVDHRTDHPH